MLLITDNRLLSFALALSVAVLMLVHFSIDAHAAFLVLKCVQVSVAGFATLALFVCYLHRHIRWHLLLMTSLFATTLIAALHVAGVLAGRHHPYELGLGNAAASTVLVRVLLASVVLLRTFWQQPEGGEHREPVGFNFVVGASCLAVVVAGLEHITFLGSWLADSLPLAVISQIPAVLLLLAAYRYLSTPRFDVFTISYWLIFAGAALMLGQSTIWIPTSESGPFLSVVEELSTTLACGLILIGASATLLNKLSTAERGALNLVLANEEVQQEMEERRWTEELLKESRLFAESIVQSIREPLLVLNSELRIIRANPSFASTFGLKPSHLLNRALHELGNGQWADSKLLDRLQKLVLEGTPFENYELSCSFERVGCKTMLINGRRIDQQDLEPDLVLLAMYDITELKFAQEEARRLARGVESAAESIIITDLEGVIQYTNPAHNRLTGFSPKELIGKKISLFSGDEDGKGVEQQHKKMWEKIRKGKVWSGETTNKKKDGSLYDTHLTISPLFDKDNELEGFVSVQNDITEKKQAEAQLAQRAEELARSNAELEQFAYIASHDLQEPLRMVSSYCQLLQRRYCDKLGQDANDFIEYAVDGAKRMQTLINDLLEYSRVGTRGAPLEATDCSKALERALSNLRLSIQDTDAKIHKTRLPKAMADETQLVQLFQNIIGNAIKFHGEDEPDIYINSKSRNGDWVFSVKDNGIGMDGSFLDRIFVIFQRLHTHKEYPGTGIGLALCKKIVERHGGSIWVDSEKGKGSTFYFSLPRIKEKFVP